MVTFMDLGKYGRFGNQMFQVASTIGIAEHNGYEYAFPQWVNSDAAVRFGTTEDIKVHDWFVKQLPLVDERRVIHHADYHIPWGFQHLKHPDGWNYVGHMQSEKYFSHCKELIRDYLTLKDERKPLKYTAIHVRMTDYGSQHHPICTPEYYLEAVNHVPGPYMLFSDDPMRANKHIAPIVVDKVHIGGTLDAFATMKACKNHIIANSTFSWWAAWLAGGKVVAPKQWFGPAYSDLETKDIYPESWIVL